MIKRMKHNLKYHCYEIVRKFRDSTRGVAAVEFALLSPLLLLIYIGTVEYSLAIAVDRKLSRTASAIADLITQSDVYDDRNDLYELMTISDEIMFPYEDKIPCIVLTGVYIENSRANVEWSYDNNTLPDGETDTRPASLSLASNCNNGSAPAADELAETARTLNSAVDIPAGINRNEDFLVIAEVSYQHFPISFFPTIKRNEAADGTKDGMGRFMESSTTSLTLSDVIYLRPRTAPRVCVEDSCDDD